MREINKDKFRLSVNKKINVKMSNMNMKIVLNKKNKLVKIKDSYFIKAI